MWRKDGAIPQITQERYPSRLIVWDTEAWRGEVTGGVELQSLRLGVAWLAELDNQAHPYNESWHEFTTMNDLADLVEYWTRKDKTVYLYAHNLKYDLQLSGLFTALIERSWRTTLFVVDDPPTFIRLKRGRMSILMVDTFNYWQFSLSAMGEQLGLSKLPMPDEKENNPAWFVYCRRDVEVLRDYLLSFMRFLQDNNLCGLGLTVASQAFRSYRHRFMQAEIILHNRPEVLSLERSAYFGGRTEAFFIGQAPEQPYYKLDINSMYPSVMKEELYPVELLGSSEHITLERLEYLLSRYYVVAEVDLQASHNPYPYSNGFKLLFPTGVYHTSLHHPELVYALAHKEIQSVSRVAIYRSEKIFSEYVSFFHQVKQRAEEAGNRVERHQAKIFLNSLYGKFGQREIISKLQPNPGEPRYERLTGYSQALGTNIEVNYLGNQIEVRYKGGEATYSSPVIAGAVTAYARMKLYNLIQAAGTRNVFYVDTDSLFVNQAGYEALLPFLDDHRLGALKLEDTQTHLVIRGLKDYEFGAEVKHKGVPKRATQIDVDTWQYQHFRGAKTWVSEGLPVGVTVTTVTKRRIGAYDKGVVMSDGYVQPLLL